MATGLLKAKKEVRIFIKFRVGCQQHGSGPFSCTAGRLILGKVHSCSWRQGGSSYMESPFSIPFCSFHTSVILEVVSFEQHT